MKEDSTRAWSKKIRESLKKPDMADERNKEQKRFDNLQKKKEFYSNPDNRAKLEYLKYIEGVMSFRNSERRGW